MRKSLLSLAIALAVTLAIGSVAATIFVADLFGDRPRRPI